MSDSLRCSVDITLLFQVHEEFLGQRSCPEEFNDLFEHLYFSNQIRRLGRVPFGEIANDFIAFMVTAKIKHEQVSGKKEDLAKSVKEVFFKNNKLSRSCLEVLGPLQSSLIEFYDRRTAEKTAVKVEKTAVTSEKTAVTAEIPPFVLRESTNGLKDLFQFICSSIYEEAEEMINSREVIDAKFISDVGNDLTEFLIEDLNFTIFKAVGLRLKGELSQVLRGSLKRKSGEIPHSFNPELLGKMCCLWIDNLIMKRNSAQFVPSTGFRRAMKRQILVFAKTGRICESSTAVSTENIRLTHSEEEEVMNFNLKNAGEAVFDKNAVLSAAVFEEDDDSYVISSTVNDQKNVKKCHEDLEPFVETVGNLINMETIRIEPNTAKVVTLSLCGSPRINRLAKMIVWSSRELINDGLEMMVKGVVLLSKKQVTVTLVNPNTTESISVPPFTRVGHAKVEDPIKDCSPPVDSALFCLNFLQQYFR